MDTMISEKIGMDAAVAENTVIVLSICWGGKRLWRG